jgi:hypothetical protein
MQFLGNSDKYYFFFANFGSQIFGIFTKKQLNMFTTALAVISFVVGGIATFGIYSAYRKFTGQEGTIIKNESHILLEKVEKVFKIVLAEGHFSEIYDHSSQKDILFGLTSTNKKALIVAKAKVLVGFDFAKVRINWVEGQRRMVVEEMPEPEILSVDSDYKFYDIDQGFFNKFKNEDYTQLLADAKTTMQHKAIASELPKIAKKQAVVMLNQMAGVMGWEIDYRQLPPSEEIKLITEKIDFKPIEKS